MKTETERRVLPLGRVQFRMVTTEGSRTLAGRAAVLNEWSEDLGGFVELLEPGAFDVALQGSDVRGLYNHDPSLLLGREKSGTLRLELQEDALAYELDLPDTDVGRRVATHVERGDLDGCSFSFRVAEGGDVWKEEDGVVRRRILSGGIAEVLDLGPVTFPAYTQTEVSLRALRHVAELRRDARPGKLAATLQAAIEQLDEPRAEVVRRLAEAAAVEPGTVNDILAGRILCPGMGRLQAFGRVLGVAVATLVAAAELDGCNYARDWHEHRRRLLDFEATL